MEYVECGLATDHMILLSPLLPHVRSCPLCPSSRALCPRCVLLNTLQQLEQVGAAGGSRACCGSWAGSCRPDGQADQLMLAQLWWGP